MFVLSVIQDAVRLPPADFSINQVESLKVAIAAKYANKVVRNVGLCIMVYDLLEIGDGFIFPGDGAANFEIKFRLVVYLPFVGEVLIGKIKNSTEEGLWITMDFFDDIFIAQADMQPGTRFIQSEQTWAWKYTDKEDGSEADLFMDVGETLRFRVTGEQFTDSLAPDEAGPPSKLSEIENVGNLKPPYEIFATVNDFGLGMLTWWPE